MTWDCQTWHAVVSSLHAMLLISKKTLSFLVFLSALVAVHNVRWLTHLDGVVVSSSCVCVNLLVWTHAPFMHSAKHPKVGREGNFCSHPVHPSYTLPNTIRASYGSCFVEYYSTVLSMRCGPSSANIDLTFILNRTVEKAVLCYYITVHIVDMRTTSFVVVISYYTSNNIM